MDFPRYLAAKFALDERSVNAAVRSVMLQWLQHVDMPECLDVGAGTGATLRRLRQWRGQRDWRLTLLEREPDLLQQARHTASLTLSDEACEPAWRGEWLESRGARRALRFVGCDIESYEPAAQFDLVVAHAVLDLVPLAPVLERFARWLRRGGYLYAAIHYDGETRFDPAYADAPFESDLLACYNASMEQRRSGGAPTGGAYCGRRLREALPRHGFEVVCAGTSDWHIRPRDGRYPDDDEICLRELIGLIAKEAIAAERFGLEAVARWREERLLRAHARQLALHVSNCDLLARRI